MKFPSWHVAQENSAAAERLADAGYPYLVSGVLASRGVECAEDAAEFLTQETSLTYSPFLMRDMDKAVERIAQAVAAGERIAIFGDYDVDGITATCIMVDYLKSRGADVLHYIPRRIEDGYGLSRDAIEGLRKGGATLLVTVDCGITGVEEVAFARSIGMDVVVTDHHECKETLPVACAVVDPRRGDCEYPFKHLAGCGVALKLVLALGGPDREEALFSRYCTLAAVGTATQPMEILLCVFLGIGNGASILVSQEMGRRNANGLRMLVRTAVWFLYLCAIPVTILAMFVGPALLRLMQVPADAFDYAVLYLRITALGTLGNLGYNMNAGILRGLGDSRSTLLLLLISCLTNIVLDVAFVAVLGMGVAGAALATTIALYLSWLASILYARRNYEGLQFPLLPHGYDKAQLAAILKVGVPLGLNNSLYSVGHVAVQAVYNMQGSVFVAGCSIAGRVTGIAGIAITSFSSAAVVFAGQNLGAGNYRRLQRGVVQITCAAGVVTLLIGLVATVFCRPLLGLFSSDPAVLDAAVRYTWWVLPFIWTYAVFNCMMSFVNGTGAVKYTTVVNLLILWAVRIPAAYILHALGYGTSSMACVSLSYAVGLVAMLGYFLTPEWGKLRRKAKELGDAMTAETEPTL